MSLFNKICFYIFFPVIFALLFTSCRNELETPNSSGNEKPEVIGPANSDIAINRVISPEKRRLINFESISNPGDNNFDFDADGFDINIDPDPFDTNMPYVQYANCYFPVLHKSGSDYKISYSSEEKPRSGDNSNLDSKGFNISKLSFNMSDINDLTTFQENLVYSDTTSDSDSVLDWTEKFYDDDNNIVNFYAIGSKSNSTYLGGNYNNDAPLEKNLLMNSISLINMIMSKNTTFDDLEDILFAGDANVTSLATGWSSTKGFTSSVIPNADSENYIHFNNKFLSVLGEGWGLPRTRGLGPNVWKNYPTELLLFTSKKSANSNIEVNGIKNTINYSPYERKNDKYQINFLGDINSANLESTTIVKILIEKNDGAYNVKFFFSGTPATEFANYINNNSSLKGCFEKEVSFKSLYESGFTIEGESLQYDLNADTGKFGNTIRFKLYDEVQYLKKTGELINKLDKEIYTIFLAVVPKTEDDFIVVGSNVHFRPNIPDTVIVPIRNNETTSSPKVLPPNYLMAPETAESILDLYFWKPSYLKKDLFNIDVGFDEKLLFIQGSNTKIVSTYDGSWLPKSTSIAAPSTHTPNPVLFISNGIEYICEAKVFDMSTLNDGTLVKYYNSLINPSAYTIDINSKKITGKNSGTLVIRQKQFITQSNSLYSKMNLSFDNGEITSAEVDVDFDVDDTKQRFIPNTDRVGNLSKERTKGVGINIPVRINNTNDSRSNLNVIIKPPLDPTYNKTTVAESEDFNSQKNNFDNNAVFNLHAVFQDGTDYILATFNPLPEEQRSSIQQYSVSYNSRFFDDSGLGHIGYSLYTTGRIGALRFKTPVEGIVATKFAISMKNTDIGDDIKLCFGFENSDIIAVSTDGDFFAVYDKKMLWRANLYIKENNNDWNDNNPWIEGNDWNRVHDGETSFKKIGGNTNREDDLNRGNGGQVVQIAEYTPIWKKVGERDNNIIDDAVSYSYPANEQGSDLDGHMDSPFDFNKKVIEQIDLEDLYYNDIGEKFVQSRNNWPNYPDTTMDEDLNTEVLFEQNAFDYEGNNFPEGAKSIEPWDNTTAPDNKWWQYVRESIQIGTDEKIPYIPGIGLHYHTNRNGIRDYLNRTDDGTASQIDDPIGDIGDMVEAGTDCLGFAQRTASYEGNNYSWPDLPLGYAESGEIIDEENNRNYPRTEADAAAKNAANNTEEYLQYSKLLFDKVAWDALGENQAITGIRIVPGDIMYYGNGTHIAIVRSVEYDDDGSIQVENIGLIESTWSWGNRSTEVINTNSIEFYSIGIMERDWKIVRLQRETEEEN